jgi:hypothetical protein
VWSHSRLGLYNADLFEAVAEAAQEQMVNFSPATLADLAESYAYAYAAHARGDAYRDAALLARWARLPGSGRGARAFVCV